MNIRYLKVAVFLACLVPFGVLVWDAFTANLGANPVEALLHRSGDWTLRFLMIVLAMTPIKRLTGWVWPLRLRRMLGLFAFFYACSHFLVYTLLDLQLDFAHLGADIAKRPYITIGFTALVLLLPLAVTSTNAMMRRLGRRWKKLHRLIYAVAVLGVIHYYWLVKADVREPLIYAAILAALLGFRLYHHLRARLSTAAVPLTSKT
jgi:methionine sulfoxide reductase heme-binding subunit